jgi:hypothetical protein
MIVEVEKFYRGGSEKFYLEVSSIEEITEDTLESIGENTDGGHESGYRIQVNKQVDKLPKGEKILPKTRTIQLY